MTTNDGQHDDVVTSYSAAPARTVTAGGVSYAYRELGPKGAYAFITALGHRTIDVFSFSLGGMVARKLILTGTGPAGGKDIDKA